VADEKQKEDRPQVSAEKYEELLKQSTVYLNTARQLQADFDNFRRINKDAKKVGFEEGLVKACEALLPALDSFKKARRVIMEKNSLNGIKMIEDSIIEALLKLNVKKIPTIGEVFDPQYHNAVVLLDDFKAKSNTIIEELQAGFIYEGKVIRYAQVVVAK
jgi:molecular chaperone GrpE